MESVGMEGEGKHSGVWNRGETSLATHRAFCDTDTIPSSHNSYGAFEIHNALFKVLANLVFAKRRLSGQPLSN